MDRGGTATACPRQAIDAASPAGGTRQADKGADEGLVSGLALMLACHARRALGRAIMLSNIHSFHPGSRCSHARPVEHQLRLCIGIQVAFDCHCHPQPNDARPALGPFDRARFHVTCVCLPRDSRVWRWDQASETA